MRLTNFRRGRWAYGAFGLTAFAAMSMAILNCYSDEDTSVTLDTTCSAAKLDMTNTAEATVKVYAETAAQLRDRSSALVDKFRDACNAMNRELGLPEGVEVHAACNPIAQRVADANAKAPLPPGAAFAPIWVNIAFDETCPSDTAASAKCLDTCSGKAGCDPAATCAADKLRGTCTSECTGSCNVTGEAVACNGACVGDCTSPDGGIDGGTPACQGECVGSCSAATWTARCSSGCSLGFVGTCNGVCTGSCDGVAYPSPGFPDAGDGDASVDAGADAGPPPGSGTCTGTCSGTCVGEASGSCRARCTGAFSGGICTGLNACAGTCSSGLGAACVTTCNGTCQQRTAQCAGSCDKCANNAYGADKKCEGTFNCGEANDICKSVCKLQGALAAKCTPVPVEVRVAGDYKLQDALKKHMPQFSAAVRELNLLVTDLGGVAQRTPGEFKKIGVVLDNARLCAEATIPVYEEARAKLNEGVGASLVLRGQKF